MKRWGIFWKRKCADISLDLDNFFENLYSHSLSDTSSINLVYREEQHNYALDIMEAIKRQAILLIEGGVGIGKSYGYLLPIFYTYKNEVSFDKILISTSSIALQEQLIKDINNVSKMLGIEIKAGIVKGVNNYACISRIYNHIDNTQITEEKKKEFRKILKDITEKNTSDKSELIHISKDIWEQVKLNNRGYCSNCTYSRTCPYYRLQKEISTFNIIVTNHGNFAKNMLDKTSLVEDLDMIVFDESHKILENIQSIRENEINLDNIKELIKEINKNLDNYGVKALLNAIEKIFSSIRASASKNYFVTNEERKTIGKYSVIDSKRLAFRITPTVNSWLDIALEELDKLYKNIQFSRLSLLKEIEDERSADKVKLLSYKETNLRKSTGKIKQIINIFEDMKKNSESNNIYWASFYEDNKITIRYIPKDNTDILMPLFSKDIPIILTSATMEAYANYQSIFNGLHLTEIDNRSRAIITGEAQTSPYNYDEHTLFYYDKDIKEPNESNEYIRELALKIDELIRMTEGKALILFTSKNTMNKVYELLKQNDYSFKLLLQTDNNTNEVKNEFADDTNSCLLATGAFWEGIDIKGSSLSNVIITRLPFDSVDAVTQYEASKYVKNEQMKQVYIPKMITKLEQGVGRLIRSDTDTGIVCCLDSRITRYLESIKKALPIKNFTTNINDLYSFSDTYITLNKNSLVLEKNKM